MINRWLFVLPLAGILISANAYALEIPAGGPFDKRVKTIDFNAMEVTKIVGHFGYSTHIHFDASEQILNIATGDADAWDLSPVDNHLFIKPVAELAETNMTVITSERIYNFELTAHWSQNGNNPIPQDMYFQVNFNYPELQATKLKHEIEANRIEELLNTDNTRMGGNFNYWAKGSQSVSPTETYDDGTFTYLKFPNNRQLPAIYIVNQDGSESLVNTSINPNQPDVVIVHNVAEQLILRLGNNVVGVFNESYDIDGVTNFNGTKSIGVERAIKGGI